LALPPQAFIDSVTDATSKQNPGVPGNTKGDDTFLITVDLLVSHFVDPGNMDPCRSATGQLAASISGSYSLVSVLERIIEREAKNQLADWRTGGLAD
jgi:hypothetical protein